jgi:hypothetical protein
VFDAIPHLRHNGIAYSHAAIWWTAPRLQGQLRLNTFFAPRFRLGWMLFALGVVLSLGALSSRWLFESTLRDVQLTVDYEDTRSMADAYQVPHQKLLADLKARGVTSVGIYNTTLGVLSANGRLTVTSRDEAEALYPFVDWAQYPPAYRYLVTAPPQNQELFDQVTEHLREQDQPNLPVRPIALALAAAPTPPPFASGAPAPTPVPVLTRPGLLISSSQQLRGDALLGFDPVAVKTVQDMGLIPTARVSNSLNLNSERLKRLLDECQATGAKVVIFSEDEVLGYDTLQPLVAREMRERGLLFGNIEFTKQRGWPEFAERTEGQLVRVHSAAPEETAKIKPHLLVDRYVRAIKERNVRVAYIRLVRQFKGDDPEAKEPQPGFLARLTPNLNKSGEATPKSVPQNALEQNLKLIEEISREVKGAPFPALRTAAAVPFGNYPLKAERWTRFVTLLGAGLGAFGAAWLLLNLFFDLSVSGKTALLLLGLLAVGVLAYVDGPGAKLIGLLAGVCVAPVAMLWGGLPRLWEHIDDEDFSNVPGGQGTRVSWKKSFWQGSKVLVCTAGLVTLGALFVVNAFNHWKYLSHTDEFIGEKATLLFPPLLTAIAFSGRVFPARVIANGAARARAQAMQRAAGFLAQPFTFRVAVAGMLMAVAGYFFLARTGNDSGMEISQFEWNFRSAMEQVFLTRPRTKEMFFGFPAMIFAAYFAFKKQPILALGAAVAASVGVADALNTFCHFWTPLFYSFLRTFHAVWIGALLGGLALWFWMRAERRLFGRMKPLTLSNPPASPPSTPNGHAATSTTTSTAPKVSNGAARGEEASIFGSASLSAPRGPERE